MISPGISYEELDPDNQNRSQDYYQGVHDAVWYAMAIIGHAFPHRDGITDPRVDAIIEALSDAYDTTNERRELWFVDHMGLKLDPCEKIKMAERRARAENERPKMQSMEAENGAASD